MLIYSNYFLSISYFNYKSYELETSQVNRSLECAVNKNCYFLVQYFIIIAPKYLLSCTWSCFCDKNKTKQKNKKQSGSISVSGGSCCMLYYCLEMYYCLKYVLPFCYSVMLLYCFAFQYIMSRCYTIPHVLH